jgi:hypothetical protein
MPSSIAFPAAKSASGLPSAARFIARMIAPGAGRTWPPNKQGGLQGRSAEPPAAANSTTTLRKIHTLQRNRGPTSRRRWKPARRSTSRSASSWRRTAAARTRPLSSSRRLPAHATSNFTWWRRLSCNRSARVRRGPTSRSRQEVRRDVRTHRQKPGKGSWDRSRASSTETPPSGCGPRRDFDRHREAARRCRGGDRFTGPRRCIVWTQHAAKMQKNP